MSDSEEASQQPDLIYIFTITIDSKFNFIRNSDICMCKISYIKAIIKLDLIEQKRLMSNGKHIGANMEEERIVQKRKIKEPKSKVNIDLIKI